MIKLVLFILILSLLLGLMPHVSAVTGLFGTFTSAIKTPLKSTVKVLDTLINIFFQDYYCVTIFAVIVVAFVFRFVLSWLMGNKQ